MNHDPKLMYLSEHQIIIVILCDLFFSVNQISLCDLAVSDRKLEVLVRFSREGQ